MLRNIHARRFAPAIGVCAAFGVTADAGSLFDDPVIYETPREPGTLAVGDFDADGELDVVCRLSGNASAGDPSAAILRGEGAGAFADPQAIDSSTPVAVSLGADLNADGFDDIVGATDGAVRVCLGGPAGLGDPLTFPVSLATAPVTVVDFDNDGLLDVVAARSDHSGMIAARNLGPADAEAADWGGFAADGVYSNRLPSVEDTNAPVNFIRSGDMNGDGYGDITSSWDFNYDGDVIMRLLNNGDGTFEQPPVGIFGGLVNVAPRLADFDGDDDLDIVAVHAVLDHIRLALNDGDGNFSPAPAFGSNIQGNLEVGDVDADGDADIVAADDENIRVLLNDGAANFSAQPLIPVPMDFRVLQTGGMALRDLNGDGGDDIILSGGRDNVFPDSPGEIAVFLTNASATCPADLDGDGAVGSSDLAILLGAWGATSRSPADLNGSGNVDSSDLAELLGAWGPC